MNFQPKYIFNYFFLLGLILLFINDHFLKDAFADWITGKLSDFAGVFILPFFLSYFFPKNIKWNVFATALFFIFWKLPVSESFIQFYNEFALIGITRVVDYTDLIALSILPLSFVVLKKLDKTSVAFTRFLKIPQVALVLVTSLVFMATSPPKSHYYTESSGNLRLNASINLSESETDVIQQLKSNSILARKDSILIKELNHFSAEEYLEKKTDFSYYIVEELKIGDEVITDFQFSFYESKLYLNAIKIDDSIFDHTKYEDLRKIYQKKIKERFKQAID